MLPRNPNCRYFCCFKTRLYSQIIEQIQTLLQADIDWSYLINTASQHQVTPLLYTSFKEACPEKIPNDIIRQRQDFYSNFQRNRFLTHELLKILKL